MLLLSIIDDFCDYWVLWWILPFLLGIALGYFLWGKYKEKFRLESRLLSNERTLHFTLQDLHEDLNLQLQISKAKLREAEDEKMSLIAKIKSLKSIVTAKVDQKIPTQAFVNTQGNAAIAPKSNKGNFENIQSSNLQIIEGIGPKLEVLLKSNGISNWTDLANTSVAEIKMLFDSHGSRYAIVNPSNWMEQAKLASNKEWQKLIDFQKSNGSDSKFERVIKRLGII